MKKIFVGVQFSREENWLDKYIANVNTLEKYGWDWVFITDEKVKSKGNFKVVPMNIQEFCDLVNDKFGVRPNLSIGANREVPSHLAGYAPALGYMFPEYVKGYDFWGFTNLDVVFGRLDKWITDVLLKDCDIFGNDPNAISGVFSLFRNNDFINNLFREFKGWEDILSDKGWYAFEEIQFSTVVRKAHEEGRLRFKSALWAESERMGTDGNVLKILNDGSLINTNSKKEMMLFHFSKTKKYPSTITIGEK